MKRTIFYIAAILSSCLFADLSVTWIDSNTIRVEGTGEGSGGSVVTNWLGGCTNCTAITPEELTAGMDSIIAKCNDIYNLSQQTLHVIDLGRDRLDKFIADIDTFRRHPSEGLPPTFLNGSQLPLYESFTNYIITVDNTQTSLVRSIQGDNDWDPLAYKATKVMSYSVGIYDYAKNYARPYLDDSIRRDYNEINANTESTIVTAASLQSIAERYRDLPACGSPAGPGFPGGSNAIAGCSCAWTKEQVGALVDYVDHIDGDQHKRFQQLGVIVNTVTNFDARFDSYARLVSGVLYNDATIVVDDGENSWSNVYRRGHSDLYDYDRSNILQRIELLLFGVTYNTSTNWGDSVDSIEGTASEVRSKITQTEDNIRSESENLKGDIELVQEKLTTFLGHLNFFGEGNLGEFALTDPITVFDAYDFEVTSRGFASDLSNLQQISRTAFQILYWVGAALFMIWFWWGFIRFLLDHVFTILKFFNEILT